jgi:ribosome-associated toxin RatA of RatAB toxin-antitoxin module
MPLVEVDEVMPAPLEQVWDVVNDVLSYPRLMDHVKSVEVQEQGPDYRLTAWVVDLKGCVMRWVEREEIDHSRYRIEYRQLQGDLARFEGFWQLEPLTADSTRVVLAVQFDIGIPMLSEMLNPVAVRAITENSRRMLMSLGSEAVQRKTVQEPG